MISINTRVERFNIFCIFRFFFKNESFMKKYISVIITAVVCLLLGVGAWYLYRAYIVADIVSDEAAEDERSRFMAGAYTGYRELADEEEKLFDEVCRLEEHLVPRSVSTQVVAGLNYRFACTDGKDEEYVVTIYKPLPGHGEAKVTCVEPRRARENAESYYNSYFEGLKSGEYLQVYDFFSKDLKSLWDRADEVPDWDLFLLAQDWDNPSFEIISVDGNSHEADVRVKVRNMGSESMNVLHLVREGDNYAIGDISTDDYDLRNLLCPSTVAGK